MTNMIRDPRTESSAGLHQAVVSSEDSLIGVGASSAAFCCATTS